MNIVSLRLWLIINIVSFAYAAEEPKKLPIVYHDWYDISFGGIENIHPFDSKKYSKVHTALIRDVAGVTRDSFYTPKYVTDTDLKKVHTQEYLDSLYSSWTVQQITEVPGLCLLPNILLRRYLLGPMRYATGGTIKAVELALDLQNTQKYAINLSGGYHHAKKRNGGGFCVYADIPLAIEKAWEVNPKLKVFYVDLDAHQGNGVASYFGQNGDANKEDYSKRVTIFDMYSGQNYPGSVEQADCGKYIKHSFPMVSLVQGENYLNLLKEELPKAIDQCSPNLIFYNAGTDPYEKDQLGKMKLSKEDIISRDHYVFEMARTKDIPIVMTLSGGYSPESADIIAASIKNILENIVVEK